MKLKKMMIIVGVILFIGILVFILFFMKQQNSVPQKQKSNILKNTTIAYFAGGCFWCVEADLEKLDGVHEVISGYMGGEIQNPTYDQVASGQTKHREFVKVHYDAKKISYADLVEYFLRHIDPTDTGGSFVDRGHQYTSAIYYKTENEKKIAKQVIRDMTEKKVYQKPIVISIEKAGMFWRAEEYHQDYYIKSPLRYKYYRGGSGRDAFIQGIQKSNLNLDVGRPSVRKSGFWKTFVKPSDVKLKASLNNLQYLVTQKNKTERAFDNAYHQNKQDGIYVDVVSGEPLFSSTHKYDSKTGWPSFWQPLEPDNIIKKDDFLLLFPRTELRSKYADSHIGHIFKDGPKPTGLRYCINSAALRFVPIAEMEGEGYGGYTYLFN